MKKSVFVKPPFEVVREKLNTEHDKFDLLAAQDVIKEVPAIQDYIKQGKEILHTFPEFVQDVFNGMYKLDPHMTADTPKGTELNRKELTYFLDSADYKQLRDSTFLDEVGTALALRGFLPEYIERMKKDEDLKKAIEAANQSGQDGTEESQQKAQQLIDGMGSSLRRNMNKAMEKGMEEAENGKELMDSLGWGEGSQGLQNMELNEKVNMIDTLKAYKKKLDLVGRMRRLASSTRKSKIDYERVELHSVEQGNDIGRLLPAEYSMLKSKARTDVLRRIVEKQALQYSLKHNETQGKGNIVVLRDSSGSMSDRVDAEGNRDEYAAAIVFGLAEIAKSDKRNFTWALFDGQIGYNDSFVNGQYTPEQAIRILTSTMGGGTSYEGPLRWAIKQVEDNTIAERADIVIITDGYCNISSGFQEELLKWKKKTDTKVYVIVVGSQPQHMPWADGVWDSFTGEDIEQVYECI